MEKRRIVWVDWMKALLIFFVVVGHTKIESSGSNLTSFIYLFHVPAFFFISGFLQSTRRGMGGQIWKSVKYLILAILFWNFFYIVLSNGCKLLLLLLKHGDIMVLIQESLKSVVGTFCCWNQAFLPKITPFWFIWVLVVIKVLYAWLGNKSICMKSIFAMVCILYCIVANKTKCSLPFLLDRTFIAIPFYILGNIFRIKDYSTKILSLKPWLKLVLILIGIVLLVWSLYIIGTYDMFSMYEYTANKSILWYYIISLVGTLTLLLCCEKLPYNKVVEHLSEGTLLILALHLTLMKVLGKIGALDIEPTELLVCLLVCLICIPFIILSKKYFPIALGKRKK